MLQVVKRSTVGNRGHQRSQLQRRHRDTLTEGAHAADAAFLFGQHLLGVDAQLLTGNVPASQFAQAEGVRVVAHPLEAEATAKCLKIKVVGLGQGLGHVHAVVAAQIYRGVLGDDALLQGSQRDRHLNGRTRLGAAGESKLLIHHGQDAAIAGVDGYDSAIHVAQCVDRRLAYDGVFTRGHITLGEVGVSKGAGGEMFIRTMAHQHSATEMPGTSADRDHRPLSATAMGVAQLRHVPASVGGFLNMGNVATMGSRVRGTRRGRFRESNRGQAQDQKEIRDAL